MTGEGKHSDFKLDYDPADPRAKLKLVKHLVAMANAGGGEITFGSDETQVLGVNEATKKALDSARLADIVESFIKPGGIDLNHEVTALDNGNYICRVTVASSTYPLVISKSGNHATGGKQQTEFEPGDIWTRHSSKTEKMTYEDVRVVIERARNDEREKLLSRITTLVNLPDDAQIQVVSAAQTPIDTPKRLLEYATTRRASDKNHLLSGNDLTYIFQNRQLFTIDANELPMIIASALRRSATLYWWLILADDDPELIVNELYACLDGADRDRSDAGMSIIELAAIYATDEQIADLIARLSTSRYKHFRDAAGEWVDRQTQLDRIKKRIVQAKYAGKLLRDMTPDELEQLANYVVIDLIDKGSPALSRKLGDINRAVWSKRSAFYGAVD